VVAFGVSLSSRINWTPSNGPCIAIVSNDEQLTNWLSIVKLTGNNDQDSDFLHYSGTSTFNAHPKTSIATLTYTSSWLFETLTYSDEST
jgi:hypothetical protein